MSITVEDHPGDNAGSPAPEGEPGDLKSALIAELVVQLSRLPAPPGLELERLVRLYFRDVSSEELEGRTAREMGAGLLHHLALAGQRPAGTSTVSVETPTVASDGWSMGGRTIIQIVTDDMPFLVDSVQMALTTERHDPLLLIHPQLSCRRDEAGRLQAVAAPGGADSAGETVAESWMHLEVDPVPAGEEAALQTAVDGALSDVRRAVQDWRQMRAKAEELATRVEAESGQRVGWETDQATAFLRWLADDHFTFLGYQEYDGVRRAGGGVVLRPVAGTGLGILRGADGGAPAADEPAPSLPDGGWIPLLHIAKAADRSTVHRQTHLDQIGLRKVDPSGAVVGERRFVGLFSSTAYTEAVSRIPVLREKAQRVLTLSGFEPSSHAGKAVMDVLESYPRDELFQTTPERLVPIAQAVNHIRDKRQLRLFVRRDDYGRFVSCVVYLPRDRYNTQVRERLTTLIREATGAEDVEFTARVSESMAARLHFVARPSAGQQLAELDPDALEAELAAASRSWLDDVTAAVPLIAAQTDRDKAEALRVVRAHVGAVPEAYKEDYPAADGASDLLRMAAMGPDEVQIRLAPGQGDEARLKLFRTGDPLSLSTVLPVLTTLGVDVVDERPYSFPGMPQPTHLYDFGLSRPGGWPADRVTDVEDAVHAVWDGHAEPDRFNALVLDAGLTWRQVGLLRAYSRYLRQGRTPYSWEYVEDTVRANAQVAADLVALFEARFDPERPEDSRAATCEVIEGRINAELDEVASLDHDKILRSLLGMVRATLRTNYFQVAGPEDDLVGNVAGRPHPYLSIKLAPREVPNLPDPRPRFEIFVYSARVEGVHLRFGPVARGGLRWSDRRDDYRTEILGLVKAQMVKNTVIVPVGAKGGFYAKRLPDPAADREAWLAEGIACYRTFISGLLDLTDNLVDGEVVPPAGVVRHDGDDTYLVVAADKGTATFSDIANDVSANYGFWLGDAFASGGSVGYDHKAMGITARGAWVSVQRHFRERGIDCQTQDFTCVGIGDMSGDVFGNGMLCSEHTRLVAAFDHRDVFLDPDPDPAVSYVERQRLFALPRSSWQDYDTSLISAGGGVHPRSAKSVPITPEVRAALGLDDDVTALSPSDLIRAILLAPVDLLWNGGIGTYVKSAAETDAEVGDKANDAIRVDGAELRCACVGEGGNLGLTQLGRIEFARQGYQASTGGEGGRVNTDFIDNSAGVDTSDHEVNIKVLLQSVLEKVPGDGGMTVAQRDTLLASMTDEVAALVLTDNDQQNLALANAVDRSPGLLHVHEHLMRTLEHDGRLDRELEGLPSRREVAGRIERGEALTTPELCVMLAYVKILLAEELAEKAAASPGDPVGDLSADPLLHGLLHTYFPHELGEQQRDAIEEHPLRREIVITQVVNRLVNGAGITFLHRLGGETGAGDVELTRAHFIAREIFGTDAVMREIHAQDFVVGAEVQTHMRVEVRTLLERVSRWLVDNHRLPLDSEAIVGRYDVQAQQVTAELPSLMGGRELAAYEERRDALVGDGVPEDLAGRIAGLPPAYQIVSVVETARAESLDALDVARVHFALGERLGLPTLVQRILALPRTDRWQSMARAALRDDLHGAHSRLTRQILGSTDAQESATARVADWEAEDEHRVSLAAATLDEICADEAADLARLSVGLRVVRSLLA